MSDEQLESSPRNGPQDSTRTYWRTAGPVALLVALIGGLFLYYSSSGSSGPQVAVDGPQVVEGPQVVVGDETEGDLIIIDEMYGDIVQTDPEGLAETQEDIDELRRKAD